MSKTLRTTQDLSANDRYCGRKLAVEWPLLEAVIDPCNFFCSFLPRPSRRAEGMSSASNRPVLRAKRRSVAPTVEVAEQRKRKTRSSVAAEESKASKKRNSIPCVTKQEMTLESSEVLESSIIYSEANNSISSQLGFDTSCGSIDSSHDDESCSKDHKQQRKRRSSRQHVLRKQVSTNQKQNTANRKQDVKCLNQRPHTPTELINGMTSFTFSNYFTPVSKDCSPLPKLTWADCDEVWEIMLQKDRDYKRDSLYIRKHPSLQPRMRSVLLDWLIEVCEVYRLHRETFYLAVDFVDRYLSTQRNIAKTRLQLVGVTALFVASKIEEIYPPKLAEFAYVTDGACVDEEIQQQEMLLLQALNWKLSPVTPISWLTVYLQIANRRLCESAKNQVDTMFDLPKFSSIHLVRVAELIDLCCLDTGYLQFSYSIIAASCLYHIWGKDVTEITGHKFDELFPCIQWLAPFAKVVQAQPIKGIKSFDKISSDDAHNIQVHNSGMQLLGMIVSSVDRLVDLLVQGYWSNGSGKLKDFVHAHMNSLLPVNNLKRTSPLVNCKGLLTPPRSAEKDLLT